MVCPNCYTTNPDGASICAKCSAPMDSDSDDVTIDVAPSGSSAAASGSGGTWAQPTPYPADEKFKTLALGEIIAGRYEIVKLLGEGGMGSVYRAHDLELDRTVALKVVRPELSRDAQVRRRFKQELILARQVTHRNIIRIFDLGHAEGIRFITMEYIEGEDLCAILASRGKLTVAEAVGIMQQVCRGLEAAHAEGVVHRDLKPPNIMIDRQGRVCVMDFGIARSMEYSNLTRTGALLGTPTYMSPEQAQGQKVDSRSDIYTAGIIFYELLTGRPPFEGDAMATLLKRIQEKPVPPRDVEPSVPKAISDTVLKMLGASLGERYQTMSDVLADLNAWDAERTGRAETAALAGKKSSLAVQGATVVLVAMLAVLGWLYVRKPAGTAAPEQKAVTVLVSDFRNSTGESVLDGTLELAFGLAMEGAPFVSVYPRGRAHAVAAQLQPSALALDEKLAQLIATREGISVVVTGAIEKKGSGYAITVKALDARTGTAIAAQTAGAGGKQDLLLTAGRLAAPIRKALGDTTPEAAQLAAAETYSSSSLEAAQSYAQAQELQMSGKWDEAIKAYEKAAAIDPNLGRAYAGLAVAYVNFGWRQEGEKYNQMAMAKTERMSERERSRTNGAYYLAMRNYEKAIEQFSALLEKFPADEAARSNLALAYFYSRNISRAIDEGRRVIEIFPKDLTYRHSVAFYEMYGGRFDDAVRDAGDVLKSDPTFAKAYVAAALANLAEGKTAEAEQLYAKLAGVSARGASLASIGLADLALYEGRSADAIVVLEKGITADLKGGRSGPAAAKMAALAAAQTNRTRAVEAAGRALAASKQEGSRFPAARVLLDSGQEAKALAVAAEMGARLEPEPQAYAKLLEGEAQLARGKAHEAIRLFGEALKLADTWLGRLDLGRAYLEAGAFTEASEVFYVCMKRKGEATAVFFDDVPSYRYFPPVYYYLGRAQEGLKGAGAADSYKTYLSIKAKADPGDRLASDARKRLR